MLIFVSESCVDSAELALKADAALGLMDKPLIGDIRKTEKGAPYCNNYKISITHTDGKILLAVSSLPVGVDIEREDREVPKSMHDVKNWTAYEALCKMSGEGIRLSEVKSGADHTNDVRFLYFLKDYVIALAGEDEDVFVICV